MAHSGDGVLRPPEGLFRNFKTFLALLHIFTVKSIFKSHRYSNSLVKPSSPKQQIEDLLRWPSTHHGGLRLRFRLGRGLDGWGPAALRRRPPSRQEQTDAAEGDGTGCHAELFWLSFWTHAQTEKKILESWIPIPVPQKCILVTNLLFECVWLGIFMGLSV